MRQFITVLTAIVCAVTTAHAETKALVKTVPIQTEQVTKTIIAYGTIEPDSSSFETVSALHAAVVKRVLIRSGQKVAAGEKLIELENAPAEAASYMQTKAAADFANQELARITRLYNGHLASNDHLAAAKRAAQEARSALAAKNKTGSNQSQEVIVAPFAGIVTNLKVSPGDRIAADTPILNITPSRGLVARLGVNPADAERVTAGQAVSLQAVSHPAEQYEAKIARINASALNPTSRLIDAFVVLSADNKGLIVGDFVTGSIKAASENSMAVPRLAVLRDPKGAYIYVVRDGHAKRIDVQTGLDGDDKIAIKAELNPQDKVVALGNYELSDGMAVQEAP